MKNFIKASFVSISVFALPFIVLAQEDGINRLINQVQNVIYRLIPILIGLALLVFLWGVLKYVISPGEDDKAKARDYMLYGIIGLFVMVSVWGLVTILADTIFGGNRINQPPTVPQIPITR